MVHVKNRAQSDRLFGGVRIPPGETRAVAGSAKEIKAHPFVQSGQLSVERKPKGESSKPKAPQDDEAEDDEAEDDGADDSQEAESGEGDEPEQ